VSAYQTVACNLHSMRIDFSTRSGAALVAGASGGIGTAIARTLARCGSAVALTWRSDPAPTDALVAELGDARTRAWRLDLSDARACAAVAGEAAEAFGGLHTVVYAAGPHVPQRYLSRIEPGHMRDQFEQDTASFFNLVQATLPHLRASQGSLVAVTSAATRRHAPRDGLSTAPKAAVEALVRGIAVEEGRFGVRANCVGPGMLTDGMAARLIASGDFDERALAVVRTNIPLRRFGTAEDVAAAVCFLASDAARYITGQKLDVDGGFAV